MDRARTRTRWLSAQTPPTRMVFTAASCALVSLLCSSLCLTTSCVTTRVDPALFQARTIAIASVHARSSMGITDIGTFPIAFVENDVGSEVLEMELGETEARLGEIFGADVVPVGKVLKARAYDDLPEAEPPDEWTQVNDMTAVDRDSPRAVPALAALARALDVDAVVVLRHEWSMGREQFAYSTTFAGYDRCSVLVVDRAGRTLWDDVVVAGDRGQPLGPELAFSMGPGSTAMFANEARRIARATAREALAMLERRYVDARGRLGLPAPPAPAASSSPPSPSPPSVTPEPPPPLGSSS